MDYGTYLRFISRAKKLHLINTLSDRKFLHDHITCSHCQIYRKEHFQRNLLGYANSTKPNKIHNNCGEENLVQMIIKICTY